MSKNVTTFWEILNKKLFHFCSVNQNAIQFKAYILTSFINDELKEFLFFHVYFAQKFDHTPAPE